MELVTLTDADVDVLAVTDADVELVTDHVDDGVTLGDAVRVAEPVADHDGVTDDDAVDDIVTLRVGDGTLGMLTSIR